MKLDVFIHVRPLYSKVKKRHPHPAPKMAVSTFPIRI